MKTTRKVLAIALCAILLVGASVMGTLAYLTSTDAVTNTFTVGNVKITLDEASVDANGVATNGGRIKANSYKLLPGHAYDKDPIVHVDANSEECWLFVTVDNGINKIEAADTTETPNIATQMATNDWALVKGTENVYAHKDSHKAGDNVTVFTDFYVSGDVTNKTVATYSNAKIVVNAYAIQKDGFDTAKAAWDAAKLLG